jgi:CheY-like chemotaxis protein
MHKSTILVVEDNEDHVFLLRHAFQKAEVTNPLQVVSTGDDAIAYLAGTEPY